MSQGDDSGRCLREMSQGDVSGRCLREISQRYVSGRCLKESIWEKNLLGRRVWYSMPRRRRAEEILPLEVSKQMSVGDFLSEENLFLNLKMLG